MVSGLILKVRTSIWRNIRVGQFIFRQRSAQAGKFETENVQPQ
jgi:hypothetical protein